MNVRFKIAGGALRFTCPGCKAYHLIPITSEAHDRPWGYDGNAVKPTLNPSINHAGVCHFWIKKGRLEFCPDSTHAYAGKVVEMAPEK